MDELLYKLLDVPERVIANTYCGSGRILSEFGQERLLAPIVYKFFGIPFPDIKVSGELGAVFIGEGRKRLDTDDGDDLTYFVDRYVSGRDGNIYRKVLDNLPALGEVFTLDPMAGTDALSELSVPPIVNLFEANRCSITDKDIDSLSKACPWLVNYMNELYGVGREFGFDEVPDLDIFVIKSKDLGRALSDKESKLYKDNQKALKVFTREFAGDVVDGVYWGSHAYGTYVTGSGDDEEPMILQTSTIAAIKILIETL